MIFDDATEGLVETDTTGNYERQIGSPGNGTGQYHRVSALVGDTLGDITIWDAELSRITRFRQDRANATWIQRSVDDMRIGRHGVWAMNIEEGTAAGAPTAATISFVSSSGRFANRRIPVVGLATRRAGSDMTEIPTFIWRHPVWEVLSDDRIAYVPFTRELRIEIYSPEGKPSVLISGQTPFPSQAITKSIAKGFADAFYRFHYGTAPEAIATFCDSLARLPKPKPNIRCMTAAYGTKVAARLPPNFPPVLSLVALDDGGFGLKTSHTSNDSTAWLLVNTQGTMTGYFSLRSSELLVGGTSRSVAIADTTGGHVAVSWASFTR